MPTAATDRPAARASHAAAARSAAAPADRGPRPDARDPGQQLAADREDVAVRRHAHAELAAEHGHAGVDLLEAHDRGIGSLATETRPTHLWAQLASRVRGAEQAGVTREEAIRARDGIARALPPPTLRGPHPIRGEGCSRAACEEADTAGLGVVGDARARWQVAQRGPVAAPDGRRGRGGGPPSAARRPAGAPGGQRPRLPRTARGPRGRARRARCRWRGERRDGGSRRSASVPYPTADGGARRLARRSRPRGAHTTMARRAGRGWMRTLITNGTVVNADGSFRADVLVDGETIAAVGVVDGVAVDRTIDAAGKLVIPGAIDVHTHMELPFGGTAAKDTFETGTRAAAFGGTTTIIDFAVQPRGGSLRDGPRRVAREGRRQLRDRLRLPHDHERRQRPDARRDGPARRRGRHRLQAVHGVSGRLLLRRRRDLPGDAPDRVERRRRSSCTQRTGSRSTSWPRTRSRTAGRTPTTTASCATRSSRARRRTGSSASRRRRTCRSTSSTSPLATRSGRSPRRATAARRRSRRPARSTCSSRSMTWATASRAPSSCAPLPCDRPTTRRTSGAAS